MLTDHFFGLPESYYRIIVQIIKRLLGKFYRGVSHLWKSRQGGQKWWEVSLRGKSQCYPHVHQRLFSKNQAVEKLGSRTVLLMRTCSRSVYWKLHDLDMLVMYCESSTNGGFILLGRVYPDEGHLAILLRYFARARQTTKDGTNIKADRSRLRLSQTLFHISWLLN